MAHYAFLDSNNIVTEVIVGKDETDTSYNFETYYGDVRGLRSKRTSYNTQGGSHILGGTPFRKNYAGIGYTYDEIRDAFIPPKPFDSWILNETSCLWEAPVAYPNDGKMYIWNEQTTEWNLVIEQTPGED
jgi:hypothetical protein